MRCKAGDLAVVIEPPWVCNHWTGERIPMVRYGTIVRVLYLTPANSGDVPFIGPLGDGLVWQLEEPIPVHVRFSNGGNFRGVVEGLADASLRPLPGDAISDEEVRELFTPSSTKETA